MKLMHSKYLLLIIIFLFISIKMDAQSVLIEPTAQWTYNNDLPGLDGYVHLKNLDVEVEYQGFLFETLSYVEVAVLPDGTQDTFEFSTKLIRQEDEKIFTKDERLLYDFSLTSGDTLHNSLMKIYGWEVIVDSIGTVSINDTELKIQYIAFHRINDPFFGTIQFSFIEKLGPYYYYYFWDEEFLSDFDTYARSLTCYYDDVIGEANVTNLEHDFDAELTKDCDGVAIVSTENVRKEDFEIYPNPFQNEITIRNVSNGKYEFCVYSITGAFIHNEIIDIIDEITIPLDLSSGLYFCSITNLKNGYSMKYRLVKN